MKGRPRPLDKPDGGDFSGFFYVQLIFTNQVQIDSVLFEISRRFLLDT